LSIFHLHNSRPSIDAIGEKIDAFNNILSGCQSLQNFAYTGAVEEDITSAIVSNMTQKNRQFSLKSLRLSDDTKINDQTLRHLAEAHPDLEELDLSSRNITGASISTLQM